MSSVRGFFPRPGLAGTEAPLNNALLACAHIAQVGASTQFVLDHKGVAVLAEALRVNAASPEGAPDTPNHIAWSFILR